MTDHKANIITGGFMAVVVIVAIWLINDHPWHDTPNPVSPELPITQAQELLIFSGTVLERDDGGSCQVTRLRRTRRKLLIDFACTYPVQDAR